MGIGLEMWTLKRSTGNHLPGEVISKVSLIYLFALFTAILIQSALTNAGYQMALI